MGAPRIRRDRRSMTTPRSVPTRWVRPEVFRSLRVSALVVEVLLAAWVVFAALAIVFGVEQRSMLTRLEHDPISVAYAELLTDQHRADAVNTTFIVLLAATGVAFIVWFWRAHRNLEALGLPVRHDAGWAIGGWFVPFLNLVRPKQIANDLWGAVTAARSGEPEAPGGSVLLGFWWAAWLGALVALPLALDRSEHPTFEQMLHSNAVYLVRAALVAVAAVLAFFVVRTITRAQQDVLASAGSR
jgi:hypothetical protein